MIIMVILLLAALTSFAINFLASIAVGAATLITVLLLIAFTKHTIILLLIIAALRATLGDEKTSYITKKILFVCKNIFTVLAGLLVPVINYLISGLNNVLMPAVKAVFGKKQK